MFYRIEYYSPLLNRRVRKTVDKLDGYRDVVVLEVVRQNARLQELRRMA